MYYAVLLLISLSLYALINGTEPGLHGLINSVFILVCSLLNACKGVFNPNVPIFQSNCAEGLHFSVFFIMIRFA